MMPLMESQKPQTFVKVVKPLRSLEAGPCVIGAVPPPEVPLLLQTLQASKQEHAVLVGHGGVVVSGPRNRRSPIRTAEARPSRRICPGQTQIDKTPDLTLFRNPGNY